MADQPQGTPPAGNEPPAATQQAPVPESTPDNSAGQQGNDPDQEMVQVSLKELNQLKRDAGRHRKRKEGGQRSSKRKERNDSQGEDELDLDVRIQERDQIIAQKERENTILKLHTRVRDVLSEAEYADLPESTKKLILRKPEVFLRDDSEDIDDMIEDLRDYIDDELDNAIAPQKKSAEQKVQEPERQTPPASGSGPAPAGSQGLESLEGKTGASRSVSVLKNILQKTGISKL